MPSTTRAFLPFVLAVGLAWPVGAQGIGLDQRTNTTTSANGVTVTTSTVQGRVGMGLGASSGGTTAPDTAGQAPVAPFDDPMATGAPSATAAAPSAPSGPPPLVAPSSAGTPAGPAGKITIEPLPYESFEISPVANPMPTARPDLVGPPEGAAFDASLWPSDTGPGALVVPARWIWERGGWSYDDRTRSLKTSDPFLQRAAMGTPTGWTPRGGEGVAAWLPEGPSACTAMARIEQALTIHRLAMDVEERRAWRELKQESCPRTLPLR